MPEPTLRDQYAAAIRGTWDGTTMHMDAAIQAETDAVMAVRDEEMAQLRYERDQLREALATVTGQCRGLEAELVAARGTADRVRALCDRYQMWHDGGWKPADAATVAREFYAALDQPAATA